MTTHPPALGIRAKIGTAAIAALMLAILLTTASPAAARTPSHKSTVLVQGIGMGPTPSVRVHALQRALERRGYDLGPAGVDGRFGPRTAAAVRAFQARTGLAVDGVVGTATRRALALALVRRTSTSAGHTASRAKHTRTREASRAKHTRTRSTRRPAAATSGRPQGDGTSARDIRPAPTVAPVPAAPGTTSRDPWILPIGLGTGAGFLLALAASLALMLVRSARERRYRRARFASTPTAAAPAGPPVPAARPADGRARGALSVVREPSRMSRKIVSAGETGDAPPPAGDRVIGFVPAGDPRRTGRRPDPVRSIRQICRDGEWSLVDVVRDGRRPGDGATPPLIAALERVDAGEASAIVVGHADDLRLRNGNAGAVAKWLESRDARLIVHDIDRPSEPHMKRPPAAAMTLERSPAVTETRGVMPG